MEKVYSWYCYSNINGLFNKNKHTHIRELRLRFKEWHSFLFHNLANQQDHEQIRMFCYCIQIKILTSSVRIRNSVCTCLDGYKAGSKVVSFSRVSSCFSYHVFSSGSFGCSRVETWDGCVTSPGKLSSAIVEFVAPLRLWHSLRPPPMVGFVVRVQRAGFQVSLARVWARSYEFRSTRELQREKSEHADAPRLFNCPVWTSPKAAGPIRASVRGGAPPASRLALARHSRVTKRITFDPCIKTLIKFTHLSYHHICYRTDSWNFCNHS